MGRSGRTRRFARLAAGIVIASATAPGQAPELQDPQRVFRDVEAGPGFEADPVALRTRIVEARLADALEQPNLVLDLFEDVQVLAERRAVAHAGDHSWIGRVLGDQSGDVALVSRGDSVVGTIRLGQRSFRVRPIAAGRHAIEEIDASKLPGCSAAEDQRVALAASAVGEDEQGSGAALGSEPLSPDGLPTVDVLVCYTPAARIAQGGVEATEALIELAVLEANLAWEDSGISWRLRLAGIEEVQGQETTSFSTMLADLRTDGDGWCDEVHQLREAYGADLVSLVVAGQQSCGIAYVMSNPVPSFQAWAFSVVARGCATGYYSFAHELGHNLGCHHDHLHSGSGAFPFSFGYHAPDESWRTIMAYAPGVRIRRFSNPALTWNGVPTGLAAGHENASNNAETIRLTAPIAGAFRASLEASLGAGKPTSLGTMPVLAATGLASASAPGAPLELRLSGAVPGAFAVLVRSHSVEERPFGGGTLFGAAPLSRAGSAHIGAQGELVFEADTAGCIPGQTLVYQTLFRDTAHPDGTGLGLSSALRTTVVP